MMPSAAASLCCYYVTLSVILANASSSDKPCIPPAECFVKAWPVAVSDALHFLGWQDVLLVFDTSLCYSLRMDLLATLSERHIGSIPMTVHSQLMLQQGQDIDMVADTLNRSFVKNVLLCTTGHVFDAIFRKMEERRELYSQVQWFVICSELEAKSLQASKDLHYLVALLAPSRNGTSSVPNQHTNCGICLCSDKELVRQASLNSTSAEFFLLVYTAAKGTLEETGRWNARHGLHVYDGVTYDKAFARLGNKHLRVGVALAMPFLYKLPSHGPPKYEGMSIDMLDELALRLNFTFELIEPPDGVYGSLEADGTWNGMVGMLIRGELDLAIGPFTITSQRENVIDFTVPFMQDGGAILTKRSQPGPDILTVFKPLPLAMWLSVGGALIVTGTALYVITSAAAARRRHFGKEDGDNTWWSFGDSVFIVYGSLVEQGASRHPASSAGRLVLGCWWLFTILIVSIYTASLAAQLTVTVHERTVDTLQDLVSSSLTPLTLSGTTWQSSFQNDSSEMYRAIGARMTTVLDENKVADLVKNNDLAYIMDVSALDFLQMQDCKHLHRSEHIFAVNGLGLAVPQGAKYKNLINNVILKLQESGVINIWKRRWWRASSTDCDGQDSVMGKRTVAEGSQPLEVVSIGGILILYGAVIVFAFFCFLLQKICECGRVRAWKERIMDKCGVARYHF